MRNIHPAVTALALVSGFVLLCSALWPSSAGSSHDASSPSGPVLPADSDDSHPHLISRVDPVYPEEAREAELEAKIILQLTIRKDGSVELDGKSCLVCEVNRQGKKSEEVLRGWCDDFIAASVDAVSQWKYEPGKQDGEPVDVLLTVRLDYEMT